MRQRKLGMNLCNSKAGIPVNTLLGLLLTLLTLLALGFAPWAEAQGLQETTVQGIAYRANGTPAQGSVVVSWPSFTSAANQQVTAGSLSLTLSPTGFLSVNLTPNQGAYPAGTYYTAVYHLSDNTVQTQYWVVPAAAQATLASVQAQVIPATQAVQSVTKSYVDTAIANIGSGTIPASGGTMTGPLVLNADPTAALQAATKHYVDTTAATLLPKSGGTMTGPLVLAADPVAALQPATKNYVDNRTPISVLNYGARCDGVTDDSAALQAALDAAYASYGILELQLPASTCYTAKTLHYRGESIVGLGPISDTWGNKMSRIQGAPGQDVLANGDPACAPTTGHNSNCTDANGFAWQSFLQGTVLRDFTIGVNITQDASYAPASGTQGAGLGTYHRPIAENSIFSPNACLTTGCWLPKSGSGDTASGWSTHFVYAPGSTPQKGVGAGWWVGNCGIALPNSHPVTGANFPYGFQGAVLTNITFTAEGTNVDQNNQAKANHTCALYGQAPPYDAHFEHVYTNYLASGFMFPSPDNGIFPNSSADANSYTDVVFHTAHVFYSEMGSYNRFVGVQSYVTQAADTDEAPTGIVLNCSTICVSGDFQNIYQEPGYYSTNPVYTIALSGGALSTVNVTTPGYSFPLGSSITVSDSQGGTGTGATVSPTVDVWGKLTAITVTNGGTNYSHPVLNFPSNTVNPYYPANYFSGLSMRFDSGNAWQGGGGLNVLDAVNSTASGFGFGIGYAPYLPGTTTPYNAMLIGSGTGSLYDGTGDAYNGSNNLLSGGISANINSASIGYANTITQGEEAAQPYVNPIHRISTDALTRGLGSLNQLYSSNDDLLVLPEAMVNLAFANGSVGNAVINDSTAPLTGRYASVPRLLPSGAVSPWGGGGFWSTSVDGQTSPNNRLGWLGETGNFPKQPGTAYVALKASAAASVNCQISNGGGFAALGGATLAVTTSWQVFSFPYTLANAVYYYPVGSQNPIGVQFTCNYTGVDLNVAFYAFVPNAKYNDVSATTVEAGTSITTPLVNAESESGATVGVFGQLTTSSPRQLQMSNSPAANSFTIRGYQVGVGENQTLEFNPGGAPVHINGKLACLADGTNCQSAGTSGSAGGDLSGSYPNPSVAKVNGAPVPTSKTIVGTNSSGQLVDASSATLSNNTIGTAGGAGTVPSTQIAYYPFVEGVTNSSPTTIADYSGNGNNATVASSPNNPGFTAQGMLWNSTSVNEWLTLPAGLSTGQTFDFYLCQVPNTGYAVNQTYFISLLSSSNANGLALDMGWNYNNVGASQWFEYQFVGSWRMMAGNSSLGSNGYAGTPLYGAVAAKSYPSGGCHDLIFATSTTSGQTHFYVDGIEQQYSQNGAAGSAALGTLYLGKSWGGYSNSGNIYVRLFRAFSSQLTADQSASLAAIDKITANYLGIPQFVPNSNLTEQVTVSGDSRTKDSGTTGITTWPNLLSTGTTFNLNNNSQGSRMLHEMAYSDPPNQVLEYSVAAPRNTAYVWGCLNDYNSGVLATGNNAPQCAQDLVRWAQQQHQTGYKTIVFEELAAGSGINPWYNVKNSLNTWIRANWKNYFDGVVTCSDPNLCADASGTSGTYFRSDGLHPAQAGQNLLGTYASNAYAFLYGSTSSNPNTTSASTYQMTAADSNLIANNTSNNIALTLPNCYGIVGSVWTINVLSSTHTVSLTPAISAQTLNGGTSAITLATGPNRFLLNLGAPSTGGCTWIPN